LLPIFRTSRRGSSVTSFWIGSFQKRRREKEHMRIKEIFGFGYRDNGGRGHWGGGGSHWGGGGSHWGGGGSHWGGGGHWGGYRRNYYWGGYDRWGGGGRWGGGC
jgi:hypothetical protein